MLLDVSEDVEEVDVVDDEDDDEEEDVVGVECIEGRLAIAFVFIVSWCTWPLLDLLASMAAELAPCDSSSDG